MESSLVYVIVAVVFAVVLAAAGGVLLGRYLWLGASRKRVVRLIGRREAVRAGERTLRDVVQRLADASDAGIEEYAADGEHEDRRSLREVATRMEVQAEETIRMALPKALWAAGDLLADAAWRVGREARQASAQGEPGEVLERLCAVDLVATREAVRAAEEEIERLEEAYGVDEAAVYGGGLYI